MSDIAGNKWEAESIRPPVFNPAGLAQIVLMGSFALFFGYIMVFSIIGALGPKSESGLAEQYQKAGMGKIEEKKDE
jgi:hypothetical protein